MNQPQLFTHNDPPDELPEIVVKYLHDCLATGSAHICDPPVEGTDRDFVLLIGEANDGIVKAHLLAHGWADCSITDGDSCTAPTQRGTFICRKGDVNLMIVHDLTEWECWRISTILCKRLNLLDKIDRVDLFSAVRDRRLVSESIS